MMQKNVKTFLCCCMTDDGCILNDYFDYLQGSPFTSGTPLENIKQIAWLISILK
jgi:hypothetical protein